MIVLYISIRLTHRTKSLRTTNVNPRVVVVVVVSQAVFQKSKVAVRLAISPVRVAQFNNFRVAPRLPDKSRSRAANVRIDSLTAGEEMKIRFSARLQI